ncbi:MAG: hypothetical protein RJA70_4814 [Pseudomonadota bacterium]|jgi:anti-sigma factor ChrR (cupin superfamily)
MKPTTEQLPEFLEEALTDLSSSERQALTAWLQQGTPQAEAETPLTRQLEAIRETLLSQTSVEPYRYAPFFSRISQLFEMPEEQVVSLLTEIAWQKAPLKGVEFVDVDTHLSRDGVHAGLARFQPSVHYPRHRHVEREENLILAGGYTDDAGKLWQAGDLHVMDAGTVHEYWTDAEHGCVLATVSDSRIVWTSPWLRFLSVFVRALKRA